MNDVEIFAVGKWNGREFSAEDLEGIVKSFDDLKDVHDVPLKFGHNDDQPLTDGQPALGWVERIFVKGDKLLAQFKDVPEIVKKAIGKKLYNKVSIELDVGVEHKEKKFPYVLSGVALLGADIPAVNTLNDLAQYFKKDKQSLEFKSKLKYTTEDNTMSEQLQKQLADLQARMNELTASNAALEESKKTLEKEKLEFAKKEQERIEGEAKAKFESDKKTLLKDLEDLVKEKLITPAQRDHFTKDLSESTIGQVAFSLEGLKLGQSKEQEKEQGRKGKAEEGRPDEILMSRINDVRSKSPTLSFSQARDSVFKSDKDLAREYILMNGE